MRQSISVYEAAALRQIIRKYAYRGAMSYQIDYKKDYRLLRKDYRLLSL